MDSGVVSLPAPWSGSHTGCRCAREPASLPFPRAKWDQVPSGHMDDTSGRGETGVNIYFHRPLSCGVAERARVAATDDGFLRRASSVSSLSLAAASCSKLKRENMPRAQRAGLQSKRTLEQKTQPNARPEAHRPKKSKKDPCGGKGGIGSGQIRVQAKDDLDCQSRRSCSDICRRCWRGRRGYFEERPTARQGGWI